MTPKEKADQLYKSFIDYVYGNMNSEVEKQNAKQCALIAVNEIMHLNTFISTPQTCVEHLNYWDKVKKEIENL